MYKLKFNYGSKTNKVQLYMNELSDNSLDYFEYQINNREITGSIEESNGVLKGIRDVEEYLFYMLNVYPNNFDEILRITSNNVKRVGCLPLNKRGIYGQAFTNTKTVQINPSLRSGSTLTQNERIKLYMAHELGHMINCTWMKRAEDYLNNMVRNGYLSKEDAQLMYDGFSLLDEATTQERAESIAYTMSSKNRPVRSNYVNRNLFNGRSYMTNFDYYGELQEPSIMFARTLRGLGCDENDDNVLTNFSSRAISSDFVDKIFYEYNRDGQLPSLFEELKYMGLLKRASYANFGYEDASYCRNSLSYLNGLESITSRMRDYREEFSDTPQTL